MKVRIYLRDIPSNPLVGCGCDAEVIPYTNKITGESDPMIMFTPPIGGLTKAPF